MDHLGDDELTSILKKIPNKKDLKSFSQVSKRFLKVACFRLVSLKNISSINILYHIIPASPNLKSFTYSKPLPNTHLILLAHSCPKLRYLQLDLYPKDFIDKNDFNYDFDDDGLRAVANGCNSLCIVVVERRLNIGDVGVSFLVNSLFKNLGSLDLLGCVNVSDESLKAIGEATRLRFLGLQGCRLITDLGLEYLSNGELKNCLEEFDLSECDRISDTGLIFLKKFVCLKRLHLNKCGVNITDTGVVALLSEIPNIHELDLSWLINMTDISLVFMANKCLKLELIYLNGCEAITGRGVRAFAHHPKLIILELFSCHNFSWEDVELVASTCICLEFVGLSRRIKTPMPEPGIEDYYCGDNRVQITWE